MQLVGKNVLPPMLSVKADDGDEKSSKIALRYCPSMDLVAVFRQHIPLQLRTTEPPTADEGDAYADDDDDDDLTVIVYRLNGQHVFIINIDSESNSVSITDVAWRHDGVLLAVTTSDNKLRLANSFSGKIVQTFSSISEFQPVLVRTLPKSTRASPDGMQRSHLLPAPLTKRICAPTSVYYSSHFLEPESVQADLDRAFTKQNIVLDDLLDLHADLDSLLKVAANLPKALANIDVESSLPKLSTLPPFGVGDDDIFSTRTSLDTVFHSTRHNQLTSVLDAVIVAHSDAVLHLRIFDSFEVGDIELNYAHAKPADCKYHRVRQCVSNPLSSKIWVLVASESEGHQSGNNSFSRSPLHLLSLNLNFMHHSTYLPILAAKATQVRNLTRYLSQIQAQLAREVKTAFDLPARFIRTLEDDLKEERSQASSFEASAYHALLSGDQGGKFQEWLSEVLGDRGVKRWEKAVSECLELTRRLISENWLPATERAGVVVSRLLGLAAAEPSLDLDEKCLLVLQDTFDVMTIIGDEILRDVGSEISGFNAFIKWLSWEVEASSLEDTSEKLKDMQEARDHGEVSKTIDYIKKRLRNTSVQRFVINSTVPIHDEHNDESVSFMERYEASRKRVDYEPPSMKTLISQVSEQCDQLFEQVSRTLRNDIVIEHVKTIDGNVDHEVLDAQLSGTASGHRRLRLRIATRGARQPGHVSLLTIDAENMGAKVESRVVQLEHDSNTIIQDVQFVDDDNLLVLASTAGLSKMWNLGAEDLSRKVVKHVFDHSDEMVQAGLRPQEIEVNGRQKRRAVAVLDAEGRGYSIYDIDSTEDGGGDDDM